jgi:hypothetical protein
MNALASLPWHGIPAAFLLAAGLALALRGGLRLRAAFPHPRSASMQPLAWMRGFRLTLIGLALAGAGAAWLWGIPWLLALSLAIGGEETLESSIAISALKSARQPAPARRSRAATSAR